MNLRQIVLIIMLLGGCSNATKQNIKIQPEEIKEAAFVKLTTDNMEAYITRPNMISRTLDSMNAEHFIPYETWEVGPYNLLGRLEALV